MVTLETRRAIKNLAAHVGQILIIALALAACAGIGSWLTQLVLKVPVNYNLVAMLALVLGAITAFGGIVFSLFIRR